MTDSLTQSIQDIYQHYQPLAKADQKLIGLPSIESFEKKADELISHLNTEDQKRIKEELFAWGPIEPLKINEDIFDIIIQGPKNIFYETQKGLQQLDDQFLCEKSFKNFVDRLLNQAGIVVNQKDPFGNGKIGSFRIHIAVPPASPEITITLRRHKDQILTLRDIANTSFFKGKSQQIITDILQNKQSFLIVGPTGSGKTTLLNALIHSLPEKDRMVIVEDTPEIKPPNSVSSRLLTREICPPSLTPINMGDLIKQSLRMRPDRLVVGEVRGEEAKDLLQALATGHEGSMGTIHAQTAKQALLRLEMLIQMGAPHWSLQSIRRLIQMSLHYLIVLENDRGQKGIKEVCRISSLESFGLLLEPVGF